LSNPCRLRARLHERLGCPALRLNPYGTISKVLWHVSGGSVLKHKFVVLDKYEVGAGDLIDLADNYRLMK